MKDNLELTALMPFKVNSDRVENKNFKNIAGKPLYSWMLERLINSDYVTKIIINTDHHNLRSVNKIFQNSKVQIRARKKELCGDFTSMNKILYDDVKSDSSEIYFMTHTTNPLISQDTISSSIKAYIKNCYKGPFDTLFSVNKFQTRFYDENVNPINHDLNELIRTQDIPPYYEENSCIYIFDRMSMLKNKSRIGRMPYMHITPKSESFEIDTLDDWHLVKKMLKE